MVKPRFINIPDSLFKRFIIYGWSLKPKTHFQIKFQTIVNQLKVFEHFTCNWTQLKSIFPFQNLESF